LDTDLLFGIARSERVQAPPEHIHQPEFESFLYTTHAAFNRQCFENLSIAWVQRNPCQRFCPISVRNLSFNFVAGRWELEAFEQEATELVLSANSYVNEKKKFLVV